MVGDLVLMPRQTTDQLRLPGIVAIEKSKELLGNAHSNGNHRDLRQILRHENARLANRRRDDEVSRFF
ncbi:hypothetical protein TIFTF001_021295 [Ficus carica]|uniref:Uncharacterized protein n=1 Tax=Ficus carica TaxID=3494 RepID=A0AA88AGF5_FICCA|nr:hypothetical protein TIFTF001_021295 [Ficus carica]